MPSIRAQLLERRRSSRDPGVPGSDGVRIFLHTALAAVDADAFEREPARALPTWLFSLGATEGMAARVGVEDRAAVALAIDVFGDVYALDPVSAATVVGRLRQLAEDPRWRAPREAGRLAMGEWLAGTRDDAHRRLRDLLALRPSADEAQLAASLTGLAPAQAREALPRAPRAREARTERGAVPSLLSTR